MNGLQLSESVALAIFPEQLNTTADVGSLHKVQGLMLLSSCTLHLLSMNDKTPFMLLLHIRLDSCRT